MAEYRYLRNGHGLYLSVRADSDKLGARLIVWTKKLEWGQLWKLVGPNLINKRGHFLAVAENSSEPGSEVCIWHKSGEKGQDWRVPQESHGPGEVRNGLGLVLSTRNNGIGQGGDIIMWKYKGEKGQLWSWEDADCEPPRKKRRQSYFINTLSAYNTYFHQTDQPTAKTIEDADMFKLGDAGMLGGGAYFCTTPKMTNHKAHKKGWIIEVKIDLGNCHVRSSWDPSITKASMDEKGFDSVLIHGSGLTEASGDEIVVYDPLRIKILSVKPMSKWEQL